MKKFNNVFCITCGETYDLTDPIFKELPLEACGECGGLHFINQSKECSKGFINIEHYNMTISFIPRTLTESLEKFIEEATFSNFSSTTKYLHLKQQRQTHPSS